MTKYSVWDTHFSSI